MSWKFSVSRGHFFNPSNALVCDFAYSGNGAGVNNSAMEADAGIGPIPLGMWHIGNPLDPVDHLGQLAMPLTPTGSTHGRSAFFIHGDNTLGNRSASHGCIILPHLVRLQIAASVDRILEVVA